MMQKHLVEVSPLPVFLPSLLTKTMLYSSETLQSQHPDIQIKAVVNYGGSSVYLPSLSCTCATPGCYKEVSLFNLCVCG